MASEDRPAGYPEWERDGLSVTQALRHLAEDEELRVARTGEYVAVTLIRRRGEMAEQNWRGWNISMLPDDDVIVSSIWFMQWEMNLFHADPEMQFVPQQENVYGPHAPIPWASPRANTTLVCVAILTIVANAVLFFWR